jgi:hypothetical protein
MNKTKNDIELIYTNNKYYLKIDMNSYYLKGDINLDDFNEINDPFMVIQKSLNNFSSTNLNIEGILTFDAPKSAIYKIIYDCNNGLIKKEIIINMCYYQTNASISINKQLDDLEAEIKKLEDAEIKHKNRMIEFEKN